MSLPGPTSAPGRAALSQGSSPESPYSLGRLIRQALTENPTIQQRIGELRAAGFDLEGAQWGRYPSLTGEVQASENAQAVLQLQQPLWTGGRIDSQINLATENREAAVASVREAEQQVLLQVGTGFFEILRLEARIGIAVENVAEHRRLLEMIQRRVRAQVSPIADETLAASRMQQAVSERLQFERALEAARVSLEQSSGALLRAGLTPPDRLPALPGDEAVAIEGALSHSGERERLKILIRAARAQVEVARANTKPTIFAAVRQQIGPLQFGQDRTLAFLGMEFRPGPGLSVLSAAEAAVSRVATAEQAVLTHERQLLLQVRSAWAELLAQRQQLEPVRRIARASDEVVASYLRQYQVGRKTWLDVLNAQRESTQARYALADLDWGIQAVHLRLLLLSGAVDARSVDSLGL
jgi:adhesin transport system outer membrane protein